MNINEPTDEERRNGVFRIMGRDPINEGLYVKIAQRIEFHSGNPTTAEDVAKCLGATRELTPSERAAIDEVLERAGIKCLGSR